jgi:hypothetical protein
VTNDHEPTSIDEISARPDFVLKCPNCGASASLPLEMTCSDHRPVLVPESHPWWHVGETGTQ